jgi:hypothetical protein
VSARHQVKRLDRISEAYALSKEGFALSKTGPAEETGFLRSVRVPLPRNFTGPKAQVKSDPDVFADALVPRNGFVPIAAPLAPGALISQITFRPLAGADRFGSASRLLAAALVIRRANACSQSLTQKAINEFGHWRLARHARPCAGHPRPCSLTARKTWMAGTSPAMTKSESISSY